jgi:hypothetical protein
VESVTQETWEEINMKCLNRSCLIGAFALLVAGVAPGTLHADEAMWLNHLDFLPGDASLQTSFNAVNSGVGGGLSGLIINSTTTGENAVGGGNKVVEKGVPVPPGLTITGVRVCYEVDNLDDPTNIVEPTFISQIRLAQLQDPPATALVLLDDATDQTDPGPVCVDSAAVSIDPIPGGLRLSLRVNVPGVAAALLLASGILRPAMADPVPYWLNHLDFLPGDSSVQTSFNAVNSGVGGGLSGLIINSTTTGEDAVGGGNKVVEKGVPVRPGMLITGARVCYEVDNLDDPTNVVDPTFISQIRLAQLQEPPATALVLLDDGTDLTDPGPVCVDSAAPFGGSIDPTEGGLRYSYRVNFGSVDDTIVVRGAALLIELASTMDIKFCSNPNAFNSKRTKGKVPVTIFGGPLLDVSGIDIASVQLCLASDPGDCIGPPSSWSIADRGSPGDVDAAQCAIIEEIEQDFLNPDGFDDLDVAFDAAAVCSLIDCGSLGKGDDSPDLIVKGEVDGIDFVSTNVGHLDIVK